ncbi:MAG: preprotein translocase subunit YajC [Bacteroidales bacterium]|nr:preprotein translocase subunit YajC [Bacteroidales bacterium]
MDTLFTLLTAAADPSQQPQGFSGSFIFMVVAMIAVFYFFMIRPQQKRQKELQKFRDELKAGDKIVTIGGIHGIVQSINESTIIVAISENVNVSFEKSAIIKDNSDMPQQQ